MAQDTKEVRKTGVMASMLLYIEPIDPGGKDNSRIHATYEIG